MESCDSRSVGIVAKRDGKTLLILRGRYPQMWAAPAGHQDTDPIPALAAVRELHEETGLQIQSLHLLYQDTHQNPCRRGGSSHHWTVYEAEVLGDVQQTEEAPTHQWVSTQELEELVTAALTAPADLSEDTPQRSLEPVWAEILHNLAT